MSRIALTLSDGSSCSPFSHHGRSTLSLVAGNCFNMCPKLGREVQARFRGYRHFVTGRPEFRVTSDKHATVECVRLMSFSDQLCLLVLADLVRDITSIAAISETVNRVANAPMKQWLEKYHKGSVAVFLAQRPDLFVMRDGRVFEKDEFLAPASMEEAAVADLAEMLSHGKTMRLHDTQGHFNNEVSNLAFLFFLCVLSALLQNKFLGARVKVKYGSLKQMLEALKPAQFDLGPDSIALAKKNAVIVSAKAGEKKIQKKEKYGGVEVSHVVAPQAKQKRTPEEEQAEIAKAVSKTAEILKAKKKMPLALLGARVGDSVDMEVIRNRFGSYSAFLKSRGEFYVRPNSEVVMSDFLDEEEVRAKRTIFFFFFFFCSFFFSAVGAYDWQGDRVSGRSRHDYCGC